MSLFSEPGCTDGEGENFSSPSRTPIVVIVAAAGKMRMDNTHDMTCIGSSILVEDRKKYWKSGNTRQ